MWKTDGEGVKLAEEDYDERFSCCSVQPRPDRPAVYGTHMVSGRRRHLPLGLALPISVDVADERCRVGEPAVDLQGDDGAAERIMAGFDELADVEVDHDIRAGCEGDGRFGTTDAGYDFIEIGKYADDHMFSPLQ